MARTDTKEISDDSYKRVRSLDVRNALRSMGRIGTRIVLKVPHRSSAQGTIFLVKKKVAHHNMWMKMERVKLNYELRMPHAYAIHDKLIAMAQTSAPSVADIIGTARTEKGRVFFERLEKKFGVTREQLFEAVCAARTNSSFEPRDLLLLGINKGRFVFMPLIDLF